jgi:hypothetical protein
METKAKESPTHCPQKKYTKKLEKNRYGLLMLRQAFRAVLILYERVRKLL